MKKTVLILLIIINVFIPISIHASVLDEIPPYVEIVGINENDYKISKVIRKNNVLIELEEKSTGFKYSWSFDKTKVKEKIKLNFNISLKSPKANEIDKIVKNSDKMYVSFDHHGDLPTKAKIKVDVSSKFKNGNKLYLYYYNGDAKRMEFVDSNIKVVDGFAEFEIDHCSDYVLTSAIVNGAINNPKSLNYVIIALFGLVMILMTYTLFRK